MQAMNAATATSVILSRWQRLQVILGSNRWAWWMALASVILMLPALAGGWFYDDYLHQRWIAEYSQPGSSSWRLLDLFNFADESTRSVQGRIESGELPWWTHPELRLRFFRPLAAVTHCLDYKLWGQHPWLMHAHSIGWYAFCVFCVTRLLQQMSEQRWSGGLAGLFFAVNSTHSFSVTWLSNRNSVMTTCFVALAVSQHHRWRILGVPAVKSLSWALAWQTLALLSSESGVALTGWLLAFALLVERSSWRERCRSVAPYLGISVIWFVAHRLAGFGVVHSGFYTDPGNDLLQFLIQFAQRVTVLWSSVFGFFVADFFSFADSQTQAIVLIYTFGVFLLTAIVLVPMIRHDRTLFFWAACVLMTLVPLCATWPMERLLLLPSLAARGLQARFFERLSAVLSSNWPRPWIRSVQFVAGWWLFWHLGVGVSTLPLRNATAVRLFGIYNRAPADQRVPDLAHRRVVLVNTPDPFFSWHFSDIRRASGRDVPDRIHVLATGVTPLELIGSDDPRTLVLRPVGDLLANPVSKVYRAPRDPWPTTPIVTDGLTIKVQSLRDNGQPESIEFRFDVPLDDPSLVWLEWRDGWYVPIRPPAVGHRTVLAQAVPWTFYHLDQFFGVLGFTTEPKTAPLIDDEIRSGR